MRCGSFAQREHTRRCAYEQAGDHERLGEPFDDLREQSMRDARVVALRSRFLDERQNVCAAEASVLGIATYVRAPRRERSCSAQELAFEVEHHAATAVAT